MQKKTNGDMRYKRYFINSSAECAKCVPNDRHLDYVLS